MGTNTDWKILLSSCIYKCCDNFVGFIDYLLLANEERNPKPMNMKEFDHLLANENLTCGEVKHFFRHYADIKFIPIENDEFLQAFYCKGMLDSSQLNEYFNRIVLSIGQEEPRKYSQELPPVQHIKSMQEMVNLVFSGSLIIFREGTTFFHVFDISKVPKRNPQESTTEVSIKGPKDSFTEEINVNISLIRKRMKSDQLYSENFSLERLVKQRFHCFIYMIKPIWTLLRKLGSGSLPFKAKV